MVRYASKVGKEGLSVWGNADARVNHIAELPGAVISRAPVYKYSSGFFPSAFSPFTAAMSPESPLLNNTVLEIATGAGCRIRGHRLFAWHCVGSALAVYSCDRLQGSRLRRAHYVSPCHSSKAFRNHSASLSYCQSDSLRKIDTPLLAASHPSPYGDQPFISPKPYMGGGQY